MYTYININIYIYIYIYIYVVSRKVLGGGLGPFWGVNFYKKYTFLKQKRTESTPGLGRPVGVGLAAF